MVSAATPTERQLFRSLALSVLEKIICFERRTITGSVGRNVKALCAVETGEIDSKKDTEERIALYLQTYKVTPQVIC